MSDEIDDLKSDLMDVRSRLSRAEGIIEEIQIDLRDMAAKLATLPNGKAE